MYIAHRHKTKPISNALNVLVPRKQTSTSLANVSNCQRDNQTPIDSLGKSSKRTVQPQQKLVATRVKPIPWHMQEMAVDRPQTLCCVDKRPLVLTAKHRYRFTTTKRRSSR